MQLSDEVKDMRWRPKENIQAVSTHSRREGLAAIGGDADEVEGDI